METIPEKTSNGANKKILWQSVLHALGVAVYVYFVALIMSNGERWFGRANKTFGPMVILMLLCFSAAIVGSLIFLRPALWTLDGRKKEALWLLFATLAWLAVLLILAFLLLAIGR